MSFKTEVAFVIAAGIFIGWYCLWNISMDAERAATKATAK